MRKSIFLSFIFAFATLFSVANEASQKDCVKSFYDSQVGIMETGNNTGVEVDQYLLSVNAKPGAPWCAAYVNYCLERCGIKTVKSAWSPAWFPKSKTIYTKGSANNQTPQQADVFGIYFKNLNRIAHVGFIDQWPRDSKNFITNEGNTNEAGSREGKWVLRKYRPKTAAYKVSRWTT